jgi:hypothetical protein
MIAMVMAASYPCFHRSETGNRNRMTERDPQDVQADREAEAEGFERAEQNLRDNAEHGEINPRDPIRDSFTPEEESDLAGSEYGEADDARTRDRPDET